MLNIDKVGTVYLACGATDLRKNIDGLSMIVQSQFNLDPFEKALFVFCNRQMNKLKILHFDDGFWLYYHRLERNNLVVEKYLLYLMNKFVNIDPTNKGSLLKTLPFSKDLPDDLKIQTKS